MNTDELLSRLEEKGVKITVRMIQRYVAKGLIPAPIRKSMGRGKGRSAIYPEGTVEAVLLVKKLLWQRPTLDSIKREIDLQNKLPENHRNSSIDLGLNGSI